MPPRKDRSPAVTWTNRLDPQRELEHDFGNLLQDLRYGVERQDLTMVKYCESELMRMYRERRRRPPKGRAVDAPSELIAEFSDGFPLPRILVLLRSERDCVKRAILSLEGVKRRGTKEAEAPGAEE
jgi:hypothetical protein